MMGYKNKWGQANIKSSNINNRKFNDIQKTPTYVDINDVSLSVYFIAVSEIDQENRIIITKRTNEFI